MKIWGNLNSLGLVLVSKKQRNSTTEFLSLTFPTTNTFLPIRMGHISKQQSPHLPTINCPKLKLNNSSSNTNI